MKTTTGRYLVVGGGAALGQARHQRGDSEHVVDQTLHQLEEAVTCPELQRWREHHVGHLQVQLGFKQRSHECPLICTHKEELRTLS